MGGSVSVTIRQADGTQYRMQRWTNTLPWGLTNLKLARQDPAHLAAYLGSWLEMRDDYRAHGPDGPFASRMTPSYFPEEGLVPVEYGLVVVDFIHNVILDAQDYSSVGRGSAICIKNDLSEWEEYGDDYRAGRLPATKPPLPGHATLWELIDQGPPSSADLEGNYFGRFREFYQARRIQVSVRIPDTPGSPRQPQPAPAWFYELNDPLLAFQRYQTEHDPNYYGAYVYDMSPLRVARCHESLNNPERVVQVQQRLLELGFALSDDEKKVWQEWQE